MYTSTTYPDLARVLADDRVRQASARRQARRIGRIARAERAVRRTEIATCRAQKQLSTLTA